MRRKNILFFSRGRGFGHVQRDLFIFEELKRFDKTIEVNFVSYGSGYKVLAKRGYAPINLKIPEIGRADLRRKKTEEVIKRKKPFFIISDEELSAVSLAKRYNIPSALITNWFPEDSWQNEQGIFYTDFFNDPDVIIFTDFKDNFNTPSLIKKPVYFTGPMIDKRRISRKLKRDIREGLGLKDGHKLILAAAGRAHPVDIIFFETIIRAFGELKQKAKLIVLAGTLKKEFIKHKARNIIIEDYMPDIAKYYQVSDLVITRAGHTTLWELAFFRAPSISIPRPFNFNPCNITYALNMQRLRATKVILESDLTASTLTSHMKSLLNTKKTMKLSKPYLKIFNQNSEKKAAAIILELLRKEKAKI